MIVANDCLILQIFQMSDRETRLVGSVMVEAGHSSPPDEPLAIPEAAAAPGGPPSDAGRRPRRGKCGLSRGLPRRLPLQSGVQKPLRRPTHARRATTAGSRQGKRWPMRKTRTALQADERSLHDSSFSLSFCLTVLVSQPARLAALERRYLDDRDESLSGQAAH